MYITPQRANAMQVGHVFNADLKSGVSYYFGNFFISNGVGSFDILFSHLSL